METGSSYVITYCYERSSINPILSNFTRAVCKSVLDAADRPYDYVVVTTKAIPDVVKTSQILAPLFSPDYSDKFSQATYVLLQNGLNVEFDLYDTLKALSKGDPRIISAAVWIGTNLQAPNVVEHNEFVCLLFRTYLMHS